MKGLNCLPTTNGENTELLISSRNIIKSLKVDLSTLVPGSRGDNDVFVKPFRKSGDVTRIEIF